MSVRTRSYGLARHEIRKQKGRNLFNLSTPGHPWGVHT